MGYTTEFRGVATIKPALNIEEINFLKKFSSTRRMKCEQGPYFVDRSGDFGQGDEGVTNYNGPPDGQPGLWCQWVPDENGDYLEWDGNEKFYSAAEWMQYLISHFVGTNPIAGLEFLQCHEVNGVIRAKGEEFDDIWHMTIANDVVTVAKGWPDCHEAPQ